eukprot:4780440-Alexandrium_andersonii.AAC.1
MRAEEKCAMRGERARICHGAPGIAGAGFPSAQASDTVTRTTSPPGLARSSRASERSRGRQA